MSPMTFGPNARAEPRGRSSLAVVVDQGKSLIVLLRLAATAAALTDRLE